MMQFDDDEALLSFEKRYAPHLCGLDEVGRGPLAGPVVAGCVVLDPERPIEGLNDSKKLSPKRREALSAEIYDKATVGIGICEPEEIDSINILQASLLAMRKAYEKCASSYGSDIQAALVDGNRLVSFPGSLEQRTVIKGDSRNRSIMAASIVAKVYRDNRMVEEAKRYPMYSFEKHKGYPTAAHKAALMSHGPCPIHRRSFAPVREAFESLER